MRKPGYSERQADLAMFIRQGGNLIILIVYVNDIELFYWNCDCLLCKRNMFIWKKVSYDLLQETGRRACQPIISLI